MGSQSRNAAGPGACVCVWEGCVSWPWGWELLVGWEVKDLGECSSLGELVWDTGSSCKDALLSSACGPWGTATSPHTAARGLSEVFRVHPVKR